MGFIGLGKPFCENLKYFFAIFSIGPIFSLVTENDRYEDSLENFYFLFFPWYTPRGLEPILLKKFNIFLTTRPILDHVVSLNRAHQYLKFCLP